MGVQAYTYDDGTDDEAAIENYHQGYMQFRRGGPRPADVQMAEGWDDALRDTGVTYVAPRRPEGYYHAAIGTFE